MDKLSLASGICVGVGAMFLLDPDRGRRRRALVRDKMKRAANKTSDALDATARDLRHRTVGLAAEARSLMIAGVLTRHDAVASE